MSSWANRAIPRKRDISKIPDEFRPTIVPRAARPEVVISESFHEVTQNEIVNNFRELEPKTKAKASEPVVKPREYVTKKVESTFNPIATELYYNGKSYVFVILRNIRTVSDNDLWISAYNSIRKFYTNKIVIIDDNSSINTVDGKLINTTVIKSEFNGAGEILPYYYFLQNKWADRMIFLHDSMFINRPFRPIELEGNIKFHWYFTSNGYDDYKKISNYISLLKNRSDVESFINNSNNQWYGCFGGASICNLDLLEILEENFALFKNLIFLMRSRKDREAFERLLGIVLFYMGEITKDQCSNYGDILKYPDAFKPELNINFETSAHILKQSNYDTAIIKVWRGR
jgi:hypothetical protein